LSHFLFVRHNRHSRYSKENPVLGGWVCTQRKYWKKSLLNRDQIIRLESLGFLWDAKSKKSAAVMKRAKTTARAPGHRFDNEPASNTLIMEKNFHATFHDEGVITHKAQAPRPLSLQPGAISGPPLCGKVNPNCSIDGNSEDSWSEASSIVSLHI
jgi:Helicase associated domain